MVAKTLFILFLLHMCGLLKCDVVLNNFSLNNHLKVYKTNKNDKNITPLPRLQMKHINLQQPSIITVDVVDNSSRSCNACSNSTIIFFKHIKIHTIKNAAHTSRPKFNRERLASS